jgi:hypothetical protein
MYVWVSSDSRYARKGITEWIHKWKRDTLVAMIDKRDVGFRKVKGHSGDRWNNLADSLAVKGRNQQSREVVIQLIFQAVINEKKKFVGFGRFSIQALANIYDFWPRLVAKCGDVIGAPEDYEIWHDRSKLPKPLI